MKYVQEYILANNILFLILLDVQTYDNEHRIKNIVEQLIKQLDNHEELQYCRKRTNKLFDLFNKMIYVELSEEEMNFLLEIENNGEL